MRVDELRKQGRSAPRGRAPHGAISLTPEGLVLGADTLLASSAPSADGTADVDEARLFALLAVAYDRMIDKASLGHMTHALKRQAEGDHARAALHLALSRLGPPARPDVAAERLFVADGLLKAGVNPARIPRALGLDIEGFEAALKRYNPSEPRRPAGFSGGGQWTSDGEAGEAATRAVGRNRSSPRAPPKPAAKPRSMDPNPRPKATTRSSGSFKPARRRSDPIHLNAHSNISSLSTFYETGLYT